MLGRGRGTTHQATSGLQRKAKEVGPSGPPAKPSATASHAYKALKAAGASAARLRAIKAVLEDDLTLRDLKALAYDLYLNAIDPTRHMEEGKRGVQIAKALELCKSLIEADKDPTEGRIAKLLIQIGGEDEEARASQAGNGVGTVSAADIDLTKPEGPVGQ